ncbi:MAG: NHLP bacteriocin system secretion protein [Thermoanaerobaculia bacterium]
MSGLFRRQALERLQNPDRLDELLVVTGPRSWIAVGALSTLLLAATIWGIFGRVTTSVDGMGIFIRGGGLVRVVSVGSGTLWQLRAAPGSVVKEGEVVALLSRPDLAARLQNLQTQLVQLEEQERRAVAFAEQEASRQRSVLRRRIAEAEQQAGAARTRLQWLETRIVGARQLVDAGLTTRQPLAELEHSRDATRIELEQDVTAAGALRAQIGDLDEQEEMKVFRIRQELDDERNEVAQLELEHRTNTEVASPYAGRITESLVNPGSLVSPGQAILALERDSGTLRVGVAVPALEARSIRPGMEVRLTPTTVKLEEYGYMLARVTDVSDYPASRDGLASLLSNESLVEVLTAAGPVTIVSAEPVLDPAAKNGFKWSARKGRTLAVSSGTLCTAQVMVRETAPISLVIPKLKELLGL